MIDINPYRRVARTFAFICYVVAGLVFCVGVFFTLAAANQDMNNIPGYEGMTNDRYAIVVGTMFGTWSLLIALLGWRVQRVFGQHRRAEKPAARAVVGCLQLSGPGCVLFLLPGALGIIFAGQVPTTARPVGLPDLLFAASVIIVVIILVLSVSWFISANILRPNERERQHAYQTYLNVVQRELPRIAVPETRALLQDQTLYVLTRLDQSLKGTLLKDLSKLNLLNGSTRIVLRNADFRRADLRLSDLPEADLQEINLEEARLGGALLYKLNLYKARLKKCDLSRARLQEANLQEADLTGAVLTEAKLRAANLSQADLQGANLQDADLRYANLEGAILKDTDLRGANLSGAIVTSAQLQEAKV